MFRFCRFSGIGCGKGRLSCGVIQKGRFGPCGEWRGDGLLSSHSELRFDRTVQIACGDKHCDFLRKSVVLQKAKCFAYKNTRQRERDSYRISLTGLILNGSYHGQQSVDSILQPDNLSSYEHGISYS